MTQQKPHEELKSEAKKYQRERIRLIDFTVFINAILKGVIYSRNNVIIFYKKNQQC